MNTEPEEIEVQPLAETGPHDAGVVDPADTYVEGVDAG